MKTTIFFFSGTGNSYNVAKILSEKLENSELIPIAKIWKNERIECTSEKIGFVFPIYFTGLPKIVYDFVNKLIIKQANYIFSIHTQGGPSLSGAVPFTLKKLLKPKLKRLNAIFCIKMVANNITLYNIADPKSQEKINAEAIEKLGKIIQSISNNEINGLKGYLSFFLAIMNKIFRKRVNKGDKKFYADINCNSCGICEKICPVSNIMLEDGKPKWLHSCQKCLACIHYCPQRAIQYGKATIKRQRYHHPDINVKVLINQK